MPYNVNKTDSSFLVTVEDGTVNDSQTSIRLIGKGYTNYGEAVAENLVHMLENFAYNTAPQNALPGQLWYDTVSETIKVYNGTAWVSPVTSDYYSTVSETTGVAAINIVNDQGLTVGSSSKIRIGADTDTGDILLTPYITTPTDSAITISPTTLLAKVYADPVEDLGIATKQYVESWPKIVYDQTNYAEISNNDFLLKLGNVDVITSTSSSLNFEILPETLTADASDNSAKLATTAFVQQQKNSPAFTGIPTAPTAPAGTNTNQIATTSFVRSAVLGGVGGIDLSPYATKESPTFTGLPLAPTAAAGTNTNQLATTAFVQTAVSNGIDAIDFSPYATKASPTFTGFPRAPIVGNSLDNSTLLATTAFVQQQKNSPAFTGIPTAPTAAAGTANTQIANTAFVRNEIAAFSGDIDFSPYATKESPKLTGIPEAPTAAPGSDTMQLATTEFVQAAVRAIDFSSYAKLSSPTFIGVPRAPTPSGGTRTTQIATTEFVMSEIAGVVGDIDFSPYAPKISPVFSGDPVAPTPEKTSNNTRIATTKFVQDQKDSPAFTGVPTAPTASIENNSSQLATTAFVQQQKNSPAFTGIPTAPTAAAGTNTEQLATTRFVTHAVGTIPTVDLSLYAKIDSPVFVGVPHAPTASSSTANTQIATTKFVQDQKVSPAFTGFPTAPTAPQGTSTNQIATTKFVEDTVRRIAGARPIYLSMEARGLQASDLGAASVIAELNTLIPPASLAPGVECRVLFTKLQVTTTTQKYIALTAVTSVSVQTSLINPNTARNLNAIYRVNSNSTSWEFVSGG